MNNYLKVSGVSAHSFGLMLVIYERYREI